MEGSREARYKKLGGKTSMSKVLGNNATTHQNTMESCDCFPIYNSKGPQNNSPKNQFAYKHDQIELIIFIGSCNKPESPPNTAKH